MLFVSVLLGSLAYAFFSTRRGKDVDISIASGGGAENLDHAWRHAQGNNTVDYGFPLMGRQEYANPLPYAVYNEFNSQLNETAEGYAIDGTNKDVLLNETGKGAVDVPGQIALIEESFALDEHPRLDPTRQDLTKGRHRRRQWSFVPSN